jgi:hypothetical protein
MDRQHLHLTLAYIVTWGLQLGYLGWLINKFSAQRKAEQAARVLGVLKKK